MNKHTQHSPTGLDPVAVNSPQAEAQAHARPTEGVSVEQQLKELREDVDWLREQIAQLMARR